MPPFGVVPRTRKLVCSDWNQIVFSDKPRFNLSSENNRVRVWRPRGERLNLSFALQRHTAPIAGVMAWGAIAYKTWLPLVLICDTMAVQRLAHDILQTHVLPLMQRLPGANFQQNNARFYTTRGHKTVFALLLSFLSLTDPQMCLQSSISGIIWDG
ncbi:UNVERIFIED_CONTAM: hypothetical protein NCL1_08071 [Trichonephila clavipes]